MISMWAAVVLACMPSGAQTINSGSTGADGPLNLITPGTIVFDPTALGIDTDGDNVFNFTTINIGAGVTVKLTNAKAYVSYCTSFRLCDGESWLLRSAASAAFENRTFFQRLI